MANSWTVQVTGLPKGLLEDQLESYFRNISGEFFVLPSHKQRDQNFWCAYLNNLTEEEAKGFQRKWNNHNMPGTRGIKCQVKSPRERESREPYQAIPANDLRLEQLNTEVDKREWSVQLTGLPPNLSLDKLQVLIQTNKGQFCIPQPTRQRDPNTWCAFLNGLTKSEAVSFRAKYENYKIDWKHTVRCQIKQQQSEDLRNQKITGNTKQRRTAQESLNSRLRDIWESQGKEYGEDIKDEEELVKRFQATVQMNDRVIKQVIRDIQKSKTVDFCFLIDATGSMQPHIDGVRDSVRKVVNALVQGNRGSQSDIRRLRFAVVAYRDLTDSIPFEVFEFNENPEMCVKFCQNLVANGGGDTPEDVFGGLENAIKLQWVEDAGTRIIFHIADAPCHGTRFHATVLIDSHPNGDPKGRTEVVLFDSIKRLGIDYYFGKINGSTDRMIELFAAVYGRNITTFDVQAVANITESIISSISTSVGCNTEKTKLGTMGMNARPFRLQSGTPNWGTLPVKGGVLLQYELPASIEEIKDGECLVQNEVCDVQIKIAENPFAEGGERIAFYGLDLFQGYSTSSGPTEIVLKEYKFVGKRQNSLARYQSACEAQSVAFFLADNFNREMNRIGITTPIKFLKAKILILGQGSMSDERIMSYERKYVSETEFVKFTNNCGYSMELAAKMVNKFGIDTMILDIVMAFSHWTYHFSKGFLTIVDLQGQICTAPDGTKKILMTDPAIHCLDTTRYAPLNLGRPGMDAFFESHICNSLCERLNLPLAKRHMKGR